jgi:hypothetical protein
MPTSTDTSAMPTGSGSAAPAPTMR